MKKILSLSIVAFLGVFLLSTNSFASGSKLSPVEVEWATTVTTAEAKQMFDDGVLFIDTRKDKYFVEGHISNAVGLSTKEAFSEEALSKIIKKSDKAVFYCHGIYCPASSTAIQRAVIWGYSNLYYYREGIYGWKEAGFPIEKK